MRKLQKEYNQFRSGILSFLWSQWTALGIAGHSRPAASLIDPESLLLCSLSLGRHDARLFDEIIDWLYINGEFINVQRLAALQDAYSFTSGPQISAIAEYLSTNNEHRLKWDRLSKRYSPKAEQPLFFTIQNKPLPVGENTDDIFRSKGLLRSKLRTRGLSRPLPPAGIPSFILRLRALIGLSARCELLCLLANGNEIHPAEAARLTAYNRKTVQNALREMSMSGFVEVRGSGREKHYRMNREFTNTLIPHTARWICWAPFYKGLEILWNGYSAESDDPLILSSHFRRAAAEAQPYFAESHTGILLTDPARTPGSDYIPVYVKDLTMISKGFASLVQDFP